MEYSSVLTRDLKESRLFRWFSVNRHAVCSKQLEWQ